MRHANASRILRAGAYLLIGAGGFALLYAFPQLGASSGVTGFLYTLAPMVFAVALIIGFIKTTVAVSAIPNSQAGRYAAIFLITVGVAVLSLMLIVYAQNLNEQPGQNALERADTSASRTMLGYLGFGTAIIALFVALAKDGKRTGDAEYHGSARFATKDEIKELTIKRGQTIEPGSFILSPPMPERGIKGQVVLPRMQTTQHGLILGGTGTGKSRGYFLPNCAQAVDTSLVVTDPKSELWKLTSGYQAQAVRYAPADPDASEGFNWIPLCADARMAELCARAIMQSGNTAKTDQFFIDTESAFLAALFAHASTMKEATPLTAYRLFTRQKPDELIRQLLASPSETAQEQAVIFTQTDARYKGAIVPAVAARLQFMRDKAMQRFTSATLNAPDFGRLRREPVAVYWCLREQDIVRLRPLTSLFFTILLEQLAGEQITEGEAGVPVTMMLDEFAKYVSDMLGESTIIMSRSSFHVSSSGVSVGSQGSDHRKMLLTPDEVMRLSETEAIIRTGNKYPMVLAKGYYNEPPRTARTSKLGEAITKDFPALAVAGGATDTDIIDIL